MQEIKIQIDTEEITSLIEELKSLKNNSQSNQEEILTRKEAAELLKINLSTLWSYTRQGKIPCFSIGNRIYYKKSDIYNSLTKIN